MFIFEEGAEGLQTALPFGTPLKGKKKTALQKTAALQKEGTWKLLTKYLRVADGNENTNLFLMACQPKLFIPAEQVFVRLHFFDI